MYLILLTYIRPADEVAAARPAHREYLDGLYAGGKLVCSGPRDPATGGVILARVDTEEEVQKIVADDPFFVDGIATYEVVRFQPVKYDPAFAPFIDSAS